MHPLVEWWSPYWEWFIAEPHATTATFRHHNIQYPSVGGHTNDLAGTTSNVQKQKPSPRFMTEEIKNNNIQKHTAATVHQQRIMLIIRWSWTPTEWFTYKISMPTRLPKLSIYTHEPPTFSLRISRTEENHIRLGYPHVDIRNYSTKWCDRMHNYVVVIHSVRLRVVKVSRHIWALWNYSFEKTRGNADGTFHWCQSHINQYGLLD